MKDSELDKKLAAARTPQLDADYVEDFPRLVFSRLRTVRDEKIPARHFWRPSFAWSASLALVFLFVGFGIGHWRGKTEMAQLSTPDILANAKLINETVAMFPNRVRAIIRNANGTHLVLADKPEVPNSPPIYVRICDGKNCSSLVTFSGQELEIAGQKITVLADAGGGIILEGSQFVWSNTGKNSRWGNYQIEAKNLTLEKL
ncbi:MAG TPA: hypothetical protein VGO57_14025 [Verrucomicrobiae bacterium]|jgi:hypothetical protein